MATYTVRAGGTVSPGTIKKFSLPVFTVPSGETFYRFKITLSGGHYTQYGLRNDSAKIGFDTWSKDTDSLHWSSGGHPLVWMTGSTSGSVTVEVTFETKADEKHTITCAVSPSGSGTLTASKTSAKQGTMITLTPVPATGYKFKNYTWPASISTYANNSFEMPNQNVTITAVFAQGQAAMTWTGLQAAIDAAVSK